MEERKALVVGAGGGIGAAMVARWSGDGRANQLWSVSRSPLDAPAAKHRVSDHSVESIHRIAEEFVVAPGELVRVMITLGTLHGPGYAPEKSLESLDPSAMETVYRVNCVLPLLWLAALAPRMHKVADCRIAVTSARVGSIADNRLGGWYAYRSAKAALNMGLRSAAIELARRAPGIKLIAFHPGTVDTPLSAPYQRGVPPDKLFAAADVAARLDAIMDQSPADGELSYVDWAGHPIPW